ncbi:hypothetical protein MMC10_003086 [Thelotrema lepadinum]|nr:hypothetical protein [Thelotrema lepadinum]
MASTSPSDSTRSPTRSDAIAAQPTAKEEHGSSRQATLLDGLKSIQLSDFTQVHKIPCARESLLTGMGAGFAVGGLRLVFRGKVAMLIVPFLSQYDAMDFPCFLAVFSFLHTQFVDFNAKLGNPWTSMTYAIFSFSLTSAGAHAFCQRRRHIEQASMARAAEIMAKKKEERAFKVAEMRAERERRREQHEKQKSAWGRMTSWLSKDRAVDDVKGDRSEGVEE